MQLSVARFVGSCAIAATMVVAAAPAEARHRHHYRDRVDAGDVIAGIFLIGAIAAIADGAEKSKERKRRERDEDYRYAPPPPPEGDYRAAPQGNDGAQWVPGNNSFEMRAVDACSWAAEGAIGEQARVGQIDSVVREGTAWQVSGSVASPDTMPREFSCTYSDGRVSSINLR